MMRLDIRREGARLIDGNHTLALCGLTAGAVALADWRMAGMVLALVVPLLMLARQGRASFRTSQVHLTEAHPLSIGLARAGVVVLVEVEGPLLFMSVPHIDRLLSHHQAMPRYLILDLRAASAIDASALAALHDVLQDLEAHGGAFLLVCTPGTAVTQTMLRSGLAASALGGTTCFRMQRALERIAARHPDLSAEPPAEEPAQRPRLYLVHSGRAD